MCDNRTNVDIHLWILRMPLISVNKTKFSNGLIWVSYLRLRGTGGYCLAVEEISDWRLQIQKRSLVVNMTTNDRFWRFSISPVKKMHCFNQLISDGSYRQLSTWYSACSWCANTGVHPSWNTFTPAKSKLPFGSVNIATRASTRENLHRACCGVNWWRLFEREDGYTSADMD